MGWHRLLITITDFSKFLSQMSYYSLPCSMCISNSFKVNKTASKSVHKRPKAPLSTTLRQDPLEAILVIFGPRALIFFRLKALGKNEKWRHFCAHAQWWSPRRRKNVEKGRLAPSNLTFLIIAIDRNGFSQNERRRADLQKRCLRFFNFCLGT